MDPLPPDGIELAQGQDQRDLYLGIQAVDVFVSDLEKSLQFYVNQLGFKLVSDVILQSGRRRLGLSPPDGTAALNLIAPEPDSDEFKLIGRPTQVVFVNRRRRRKIQRVEETRSPLPSHATIAAH